MPHSGSDRHPAAGGNPFACRSVVHGLFHPSDNKSSPTPPACHWLAHLPSGEGEKYGAVFNNPMSIEPVVQGSIYRQLLNIRSQVLGQVAVLRERLNRDREHVRRTPDQRESRFVDAIALNLQKS